MSWGSLIFVLISTAVAWSCAEAPEVECESLVLDDDERCPGHCVPMGASYYQPGCNGRTSVRDAACITPIAIFGEYFNCMVRVADERVYHFPSYVDSLFESGHWRGCTDHESSAIGTAADHCEPPSTRTDCERFDPLDDGGCPEGCYEAKSFIIDASRQCAYRFERRGEVVACISGGDSLPDHVCLKPDWNDSDIIIPPRQHEGLPEGWRVCNDDETTLALTVLPACALVDGM